MTTDASTRIWLGDSPWATIPNRDQRGSYVDASPAAHDRLMAPVDRAIILGHSAERLNARIEWGIVRSFAAQAPARRFAVMGIDPSHPNALEKIAMARNEGAIGINVSPGDQSVRPTDERMMQVLELCASNSMVVFANNPALRAPGSVLEWADPALFDEAARTIRDLVLVFGDLGLAHTESGLNMLAKHERVFATTESMVGGSWRLRRTLVDAYERSVTNKLLFASGFPRVSPEAAIERIYGVSTSGGGAVPTVPRETLRGIVERDTLSALSVKRDAIARRERETNTPAEVERANS